MQCGYHTVRFVSMLEGKQEFFQKCLPRGFGLLPLYSCGRFGNENGFLVFPLSFRVSYAYGGVTSSAAAEVSTGLPPVTQKKQQETLSKSNESKGRTG